MFRFSHYNMVTFSSLWKWGRLGGGSVYCKINPNIIETGFSTQRLGRHCVPSHICLSVYTRWALCSHVVNTTWWHFSHYGNWGGRGVYCKNNTNMIEAGFGTQRLGRHCVPNHISPKYIYKRGIVFRCS